MADLVEHEPWLEEDHRLGKAQQRHAVTTEPEIAPSVAEGPAVVRGAVGLDRESYRGAVEVSEVAADRVLPAELQSEQLAVAQQGPERSLGRCRCAPVGARPEGAARVVLFHVIGVDTSTKEVA